MARNIFVGIFFVVVVIAGITKANPISFKIEDDGSFDKVNGDSVELQALKRVRRQFPGMGPMGMGPMGMGPMGILMGLASQGGFGAGQGGFQGGYPGYMGGPFAGRNITQMIAFARMVLDALETAQAAQNGGGQSIGQNGQVDANALAYTMRRRGTIK